MKTGDRVSIKNAAPGFYQFHRHCPPNHLGFKFKTCEVLIASSDDFSVARVATFPLKSIRKLK